MFFAIWTLIIGALLITMALSSTLLKRLPLSTAMLYLAVPPCCIWPWVTGWVPLDWPLWRPIR